MDRDDRVHLPQFGQADSEVTNVEEHLAPERTSSFRRFVLLWGCLFVGLATLPNLYAFWVTPEGALYLGSQHNLDDHMVYAAWMRQAIDGAFFFDNRFTNEDQPGLTVHLYYLVLGWLARVVGIPVAVLLAKVGFGLVAVVAVGRLIERFANDERVRRLSFVFALFGAGLGGLMFQNFGVAAPEGVGGPLRPLLLGRLPVDVWQPEVFLFPSVLVNGLFSVSLTLIVVTFLCVLDARDSWRPVVPGFVAFGLLMNIHSYDVLLIVMVLVAFLAMCVTQRSATVGWVARAVVIGCGAILPALWFLHVLQQDAVFQARAATETFSPNFRLLVAGILLCAIPVWIHLSVRIQYMPMRRRLGTVGLVFLVFLGLVFSSHHTEGYWMLLPEWLVAYVVVCALLCLVSTGRSAFDLVLAWAAVGLLAPYFPGLFQRKLAMMLAIPWGLLGAWALYKLLRQKVAHWRAATAVTAAILFAVGPNLRWLLREFALIQGDVSNTTMHAVFVEPDVARAIDYLNRAERAGDKEVIVAMPGVGSRNADTGEPMRPIVPDYNAVLAGLTGRYAPAGHWSETPSYLERRNEVTRIFLPQTSEAEAREWLRSHRVKYLLAPRPESVASAGLSLRDLSRWGAVVVDGGRFQLIRLDP